MRNNLSCTKTQTGSDSPKTCLRAPTNDFVEDSSISEDNNSLVHSNYDHRGSIYNSQLSPSNQNNHVSHHAYYSNTPQNLSVINRAINNVSPLSSSSSNAIEIRHLPQTQQASSPTPSTSSSNSASTLSSLSPTNLTITVSSSSNGTNNSSSVSPHHTHFHKKYLRTQMQEQQQLQSNGSNNMITADGKTVNITTEEIVRQQLHFAQPIINYR